MFSFMLPTPKVSIEKAFESNEPINNIIFLDVRDTQEYQQGHIPNSLFLPKDAVSSQISREVPDKNTPIFVYSQGEKRSITVTRMLKKMGYQHAYAISGGIHAWIEKGFIIETL